MFPGIWNVLGDFGQEIEWIEHLEVAGRTRQQFFVAWLWKSAHRIVLGLVDDFSRLGHLDHPCLAEGAPEEVLDQPLDAGGVPGLQPHALLDAESENKLSLSKFLKSRNNTLVLSSGDPKIPDLKYRLLKFSM